MEDPITQFQGEYRWLSNFWFAKIETRWGVYPTVEHAFTAAKTFDKEDRLRIARLAYPADAKRYGRRVVLRDDWLDVRLRVMKMAVEAKFHQHADLAQKLLETGNRELIEGNTWNDRFWGVCRGQGENHLGRILMDVRSHLQ